MSPSVLKEGIYYCQLLINQLPAQIFHNINLLPLGLLLSASLLLCFRAILLVAKERKLKNKLRSNLIINNRFEKILKKLKLTNNTVLVEDEDFFAFCLGVSPRIYISTALFNSLNDKELEVVLRHEKYHLKNKDTLLSFIISVSKPLFLLVPILSDIERNYKIGREIRADREALAGLGNKKPLLSVIEKILRVPKFDLNYQVIAGFDAMESRIEALVKDNFKFIKYRKRNILITVITLALFLFFTMSPAWAIDLHSEKEGTICVTPPLYTPANLSIDKE